MKKIILVALLAAMTVSVSAQTYPGRSGGNYIDHATLPARSQNYKHVINDKSHDVCIDKKNGRKAWFSDVGGRHFLGWYDESITQSEKKYLQDMKKKAKKEKAASKKSGKSKKSNDKVVFENVDVSNAFSSDAINVK